MRVPIKVALAAAVAITATSAAVAPVSAAVPTTTAATVAGAYYPVTPSRILDTRSGLGASGPIGAGRALSIPVTSHGGVPSNSVSAVVLNLTVTGATDSSFVSVYPAGRARPTASTINFPKNFTAANLVTVPLDSSGKVAIYNAKGAVHVIADVVGWYAASDTVTGNYGASGGFRDAEPNRLYDSRTDTGGEPFFNGDFVTLPVDFGPDINPHIRTLVVNVTATTESASGFLRTWSGADPEPSTSTLNFPAGRTVSNSTMVPVVPCPTAVCDGDTYPSFVVKAYTGGTTHIVVDLVGLTLDSSFTGGDYRFKPLASPQRIVDTRTSLGASPFTQGQTKTVTVPDGVADGSTTAIVANVTALQPSASTYFTLWADGQARPSVTTVSSPAGGTVANAAIVPVQGAAFDFYNVAGRTHALVDVAGTMEDTSTVGKAAARSAAVTPAVRSTVPATRGH